MTWEIFERGCVVVVDHFLETECCLECEIVCLILLNQTFDEMLFFCLMCSRYILFLVHFYVSLVLLSAIEKDAELLRYSEFSKFASSDEIVLGMKK